MADKKHHVKIETEPKKTESSKKNWEEVSNRAPEATEQSEKLPGELEHLSYPELAAKLTETEQQAQKNYDNLLLAKAELDNFRRRADKEKSDALNYGISKLVKEVIPVLDSLEQGLSIAIDVKNALLDQLRAGMELTYKMLLDTLTKYGIAQIDPKDQPFNPELHEAMAAQENAELPPNTVINVFQKGYTLHGRLLRPARVIVSK